MVFILDTDHLPVLQWREQPACSRLLKRLEHLPADNVATTIISFQEQVQGWLAD
jgi:tRNA(fMet)-specific endonuclease VapC